MANVTRQERGGAGGWIRTAPEFVQQVQTEARKIVWPTRRETITTAVMVVLMTLLLGIFFFGVDTLFNATVQFLLSLAGKP